MPEPIAFNIDAYGNYARASALADYVEFAALCGIRLGRAGLADRIVDANGVRRMEDMFVDEQADDDDDEVPSATDPTTSDGPGMTQAGRSFDLLAEREEVLGDLYPFTLEDGHLELRDDVDPNSSMYVALLTIALAHASKVDCAHDPRQVLEETVTRALGATGALAVNVGAVSRQQNDFRKTIKSVGDASALQSSPTAATTLKYANEEGVDCLGHLRAGAPRGGGAWVFLGQVTCGESETWEGKLDQPKPPMWKKLLNTGIDPMAFLAVPHHVEPKHLTKLVQDSDRVVIDRLRLTQLAGAPSAEEVAIIGLVLNTGVERLA